MTYSTWCNGYGSSLKDPKGVDRCTRCGGSGIERTPAAPDNEKRLAECLTKGRLVYIGGRLKGRTWTGRDGLERYMLDIVASELRSLSSRPRPAGAAAAETDMAA